MNNSGTVSVELRLLLDQLRKDTKQAADMLKAALGGAVSTASAGTAKATKDMSDLERQTRKTSKSFEDLKRGMDAAWRKNMGVPKIPNVRVETSRSFGPAGPGAVLNQGVTSVIPPQNYTQTGRQKGTGLPPVAFPIPGAPPPPAAGGGGRSPFAAINAALSSPLAIAAQLGAALAGLRVVIGLVRFAFEKLMVPLRAVAAIAEQQRRLYANSLQMGAGTDFGVRTSMLSDVMGVGQNDVLKYSEAIKVLNEKMRSSINTMKETNRPLTMVSWNFKALQASFAALTARISAGLAPSINRILELVRVLIDSATNSGLIDAFFAITNAFSSFVVKLLSIPVIISKAIMLMGVAVGEGVEYFFRQVKNSMARSFGGTIDKRDVFDNTKREFQAIKELINVVFKRRDGERDFAPAPVTSANRMATSAWERMGLVIGVGSNANPAAETARNTKRSAELLERIANNLGLPRGETTGVDFAYSKP